MTGALEEAGGGHGTLAVPAVHDRARRHLIRAYGQVAEWSRSRRTTTLHGMIPEILRLVGALQTSDRDGVSCPANWHPGEDVVLGAPRTQAEPEARLTDDSVKLTDWYLATKPGTPS
ncbi:alkylhydroperoxidase family enzyme [Streptomyces canus]